jgi:multimeric flavodoxin WrbA
MGKNVLIISSSPRRGGNSDTLCDEFLRGAKDAGNEAEKIFLKDKQINYCTGCYTCEKRGSCIQKDEAADVIEKMAAADVIVMATPVYFYTMCAQMKTLIDRTVAAYTRLSGKEFYFIVTAGDDSKPAMERTIEGFRGFLSCLESPSEKGVVYGVGAFEVGDIQGTPAMAEAYEMGKNV